jgi:hypothetical protein
VIVVGDARESGALAGPVDAQPDIERLTRLGQTGERSFDVEQRSR